MRTEIVSRFMDLSPGSAQLQKNIFSIILFSMDFWKRQTRILSAPSMMRCQAVWGNRSMSRSCPPPFNSCPPPRGFCPASHLSLTIAYAELVMTTLVVQWGLNQHGEHAIHAPFVDALFTSDWLR
jgi:hypothetical protein